MNIRANAWHLHVFLQAYVYDRNWLDVETYDELKAEGAPDGTAYQEEEKRFNEMHEDQITQEMRAVFFEHQSTYKKDLLEWRKEQAAAYTAKNSREVSERLYAGKMSLCPYFWSVLAALVFYYVVVRSTRPFRRFFNNIADGLANVAGAAILILLVGGGLSLLGYLIYASWDEIHIPRPAEIATGVKNQVQQYKQEHAAEMERAKTQQAAQQAYEQEHPDEAKKQREADRRSQQFQKDADWIETKQQLQDFGLAMLGLLGILAFIAAFGTLWWLLEKKIASAEKQPSLFRLWLTRKLQKLSAKLEPLRLFCKDTIELIAAFARAKKEKVCPYLHITNGQNGHSQA